MQAITIQFDNGCAYDDRQSVYSVSGKVPIVNVANVKKFLATAKRKIDKWLLFGEALMVITDYNTGEVLGEGRYSYNAFSGRGEYSFKLEV